MPDDSKSDVASDLLRLVSAHAPPAEKAIAGPRSKTWSFRTDPWVLANAATQFFKLDTLRFTIFEDHTAKYTMQWNATSLGWRAPSYGDLPPDISVEIKNNQGGVMDKWDIGKHDMQCVSAHPVIFQSQGLVGVLDLASEITLTIGATRWTRCQGA